MREMENHFGASQKSGEKKRHYSILNAGRKKNWAKSAISQNRGYQFEEIWHLFE